jgi:hypothetical protein
MPQWTWCIDTSSSSCIQFFQTDTQRWSCHVSVLNLCMEKCCCKNEKWRWTLCYIFIYKFRAIYMWINIYTCIYIYYKFRALLPSVVPRPAAHKRHWVVRRKASGSPPFWLDQWLQVMQVHLKVWEALCWSARHFPSLSLPPSIFVLWGFTFTQKCPFLSHLCYIQIICIGDLVRSWYLTVWLQRVFFLSFSHLLIHLPLKKKKAGRN